ncbi:MAG: response regulator [Verrucomicrobia bacterium]|nr:response regulator [Verrucomicrobiota bacterium]
MAPKDPYRYFRVEARELLEGLQRGLDVLAGGGAAASAVPGLLRVAHTLKGAARVVKLTAVSDLAHQLEELIEPDRAANAPLSAEKIADLRNLVQATGSALEAIDRPAPSPVAPASAPAAPAATVAAGPTLLDTIRLQVTEVDAVLAGVTETAAELAALRADFRSFEQNTRQARLLQALAGRQRVASAAYEAAVRIQTDAGDLATGFESARQRALSRVERLTRNLRNLHEETGRLRLIPTEALWHFLDRAVRDAAQTLGKRARLETSGRTLRIDTPVFAALQEALLHLVRNAVAHGIEPEAARRAAGKPPEGFIRVHLSHGISRLTVRCEDDGAGINVPEVHRAAAAKGWAAAGAPVDMAGAIRLVQLGGLTTTSNATEISGRGVGLDAVRNAAARLGGEFSITSTAGKGTTMTLVIPVTLSTLEVLTAESAGQQVMLPLESIVRVVRAEAAAVRPSARGEELRHGREVLPYASLHRFLAAGEMPFASRRFVTAIIIRGENGPAALGVDRLLGVSEAVVRPLPVLADTAAHVTGVSPQAGGAPRLVLDARALASAIDAAGAEAAAAAETRAPILVTDDSLTTRMLEKSILESAGYSVDTAVSGEDALEKLRQKRYSLLLCDVEMPGMDGFGVIEHIRRDPLLRTLPAIMVTSRESREDRQRGLAVGANDYVVKGDFDQRRLLQRIRELLA